MSIQNDLSVSPYFDDYSEKNDYYKILFRPGVSVQTRELNQLQTILQKQIERFGDNIFKTGTIISGCDIAFHSNLKYVKLKDVQTDSAPVVVSNYAGYSVKNENDIIPLTAKIIATDSGFESKAPNLNTLYLRYINSGTDSSLGVKSAFEAGGVLTVFNPLNVIEKIIVADPSRNFLDTDKVVILSAIAIQNANNNKTFTTTFATGDYITNGTANVRIIATPDSNTLSDAMILQIKPRNEDLKAGDSRKWTFNVGDTIQKVGAAAEVINVSDILGTGASAAITTDTLGQATTVNIITKGTGYLVLPSVSISSSKASVGDINKFVASAQNYLARVTIASSDNPVGSTYGMTVSSGIIYQKGYFSRVAEQLVIVEKYNNTPNQKSVGFQTVESIVTSNQDESLLDNATGSPNYTAPGANRLKLIPKLTVINKTSADVPDDFLYIAEFSNGQPYKQNRQTVYNVIEKDIAQRSYEQAGDYVLDPFLVNTKSPTSFSNEATKFNVLIDPGTAYINGNRIQTLYNYEESIDKGIDTIVGTGTTISMNYGNFVYVNQLAGVFEFNKSPSVVLYDTAKRQISNTQIDVLSKTVTPVGTSIGTARIRSIVHDAGVPGTATGRYRLYLYDIRMNRGYNFKRTRSIYYPDGNKAICDVILSNGNAVLNDSPSSSLIFNAGQNAIKSISNITYIYRTISQPTIGTNGQASISLPLVSGTETFPYSGTLSTTAERDFVVIPANNLIASVDLTGNITTQVGNNIVVGNTTISNTQFTKDLLSGDYIQFSDGTVKQISKIANDSILYLTANAGVALTSTSYKMFFPANVSISFARSNRTIKIDSTTQLTINIGTTLAASSVLNVAHNVKSIGSEISSKTVNRSKYVRLRLANNVTANTGPWALGVADAIRLNKVYKGPNATFTATPSDTVFDVTNDYYIDHNQNEDYYGISYLYKKPNTISTITSSDFLLVSFDYITSTSGVKIFASSGIVDDSIPLSSSFTKVNTLEIPEVYGTTGTYYDLRDQIDLRPITNNSIVANSNPAFAPINPIEPLANSIILTSGTYKFPAPDSEMTADVEYYLPRVDRVVVSEDGNFNVIKGTPGSSIAPEAPDNALTLNVLNIPQYPSVPYGLSANTTKFADTGIANEKYTTRRIRNYRISTTLTDNDISILQPRNYTMSEISKLERRISDLEYYTSLSLVETLTQKRTIPSAIDSTVDRYKFGFYVDGFEDYTHSDISNPGYKAAIVDGYLSAPVTEFNLNTVTISADNGLPYVETSFVSQNKATDGPVSTTSATNQITTTSKVCIIQSQRNINGNDNGDVYDEFFYTFGSQSDTFDMYMVAEGGKMAVEVYQSVSPVGPWNLVTSSQFAQAITTDDVVKNKLTESLGNVAHPGTLTNLGTGPVDGWILDQLKLTATHNPNNGLYYKIRVYKGIFFISNSIVNYALGYSGTVFKYKLCYPTDAKVNQINTDDTTNYQMEYGGSILNRPWAGGPRPFGETGQIRNV
jgi:hypothetical protein